MMRYCFLLFLFFVGFSLKGQEEDTFAYSIDLDEFVISAQYEPTHYKEAIYKVEVISTEQILSRGAVSLEQALQISPAIRITQDPILGAVVTMRGVQSSNVAILVDGVPVIGRLNGAIDLSQISMQNVERIELVEGALSNFYGSNAAGGVVNIITKKSVKGKGDVSIRSQLESIGQQNHEINFGASFGKWMARAHARYFDFQQFEEDSFRVVEQIELEDGTQITQSKYPLNPKQQKSVGTVLRYNIDDQSSIVFKADYNVEDVQDFGAKRRLQFNPYAQEQFFNTVRGDFSLNAKKKWNEWYVELTSAYNRYDRITEEKRYYFDSMSFDPILQSADTSHFNNFFNRLVISKAINNKLSVNGGLNYTKESAYGDRIIDRNNVQDSTRASFSEWAPFVDLQYKVSDAFKASLSTRYSIHSVYDAQWTPAVQFFYTPSEKWTLRGGYAQGYRSPSLKELYLEFVDVNHNIIGNLNLQPEISHDIQATLSYEPNKSWNLSLNVYQTNIENRISLFEYESLKFQYENVDAYQVRGIQPSIKWSIGVLQFNSAASVGFWSTNIESDSAPKYGRVFDWNNALFFAHEASGIGVSLNHRMVGDQPGFILNNNDVEVQTLEGYNLVDVSVQRSFWKNKLALNLGVKNLIGIDNTNVSGSGATGPHSASGRNIVSPGRSYFLQMSLGI